MFVCVNNKRQHAKFLFKVFKPNQSQVIGYISLFGCVYIRWQWYSPPSGMGCMDITKSVLANKDNKNNTVISPYELIFILW